MPPISDEEALARLRVPQPVGRDAHVRHLLSSNELPHHHAAHQMPDALGAAQPDQPTRSGSEADSSRCPAVSGSPPKAWEVLCKKGKAGHHEFTTSAGVEKGMRVSFQGLHQNA